MVKLNFHHVIIKFILRAVILYILLTSLTFIFNLNEYYATLARQFCNYTLHDFGKGQWVEFHPSHEFFDTEIKAFQEGATVIGTNKWSFSLQFYRPIVILFILSFASIGTFKKKSINFLIGFLILSYISYWSTYIIVYSTYIDIHKINTIFNGVIIFLHKNFMFNANFSTLAATIVWLSIIFFKGDYKIFLRQ